MKIDYISDTHLDLWCKQIDTESKEFDTYLNKITILNYINTIRVDLKKRQLNYQII